MRDREVLSRSFELSNDVDTSKIRAELNRGVLCLHLPKNERVKPRESRSKAEPPAGEPLRAVRAICAPGAPILLARLGTKRCRDVDPTSGQGRAGALLRFSSLHG